MKANIKKANQVLGKVRRAADEFLIQYAVKMENPINLLTESVDKILATNHPDEVSIEIITLEETLMKMEKELDGLVETLQHISLSDANSNNRCLVSRVEPPRCVTKIAVDLRHNVRA